MCGILGKVDRYKAKLYTDQATFNASMEMLSNRGPDFSNTWRKQGAILGHTRLAVIETSSIGNQPMTGYGYAIVFNGEIYNYKILRERLILNGYQFKTNSDTEVLLAGWDYWKSDLLNRINGMFAFAILNTKTNNLVIARDRFGKKPIYYAEDSGELLFSSNLLALEKMSNKKFDINLESLSHFFQLRYVPGEKTMLSGVFKLGAGCLLTFNKNGLSLTNWYDKSKKFDLIDLQENYSSHELKETLRLAVHDRMIADVPLGVFLSGGVDSSVIATLMSEKNHNIKTFTIGFPDSKEYDESEEARLMSRHLGTDHTEINVTASSILKSLDDVFDGLDEPFSDNSAIPMYVLARNVKDHVTVALSGDGGDEIFGGYRKYKANILAEKYKKIPKIFKIGVEKMPKYFFDYKNKHFDAITRFIEFSSEGHLDKRMSLIMTSNIDEKLIKGISPQSVGGLISHQLSEIKTNDFINKVLYFDQSNSLVDQMLTKVDRMSMASGLEVRSPFLDHRVVDFVNKIKGVQKISMYKNKPLLEQAFKNEIPKKVFNMRKKGFDVPMSEWIRQELLDVAKWAVDPNRLSKQGIFDELIPGVWLTQHLNYERDYSKHLWSMIVFQKWYERRIDSILL
jgi:asparagine synthase (glutamine-hydrolysing)